jgi:hypothetical protein
MKKFLAGLFLVSMLLLSSPVFAQMTFYLIDNFEDGDCSQGPGWYTFGTIKPEVIKNPMAGDKTDFIAQTAGQSIVMLKGETKDWYVGGIGTSLNLDATSFSRIQFDVYGSDKGGTLKVELYQDDNFSGNIELDPNKNWEPINDSRWVADVSILGAGFTRYSIPFSAFRHDNLGVGSNKWNPVQKNNTGGLLKIQFVMLGKNKDSKIEVGVDNVILTY